MASNFTQNFTLLDIFNNKKLKDKVPLINYKETIQGDGKVSTRTNPKTINKFVFDISTTAARPFYKNINTARSGDKMIISGDLIGDHDACVDAIYNAISSKKTLLMWTVNNTDMIRDALKESEKNKRKYGITSKLFLRVQSMQQIEGMTKKQIYALMKDIMDNIVLGDNFPQTQKKYNVKDWAFPSGYNTTKLKWKQKVGDL